MIEIDRFYNAALANPTVASEEFRDRADAAKNPQRVRRAETADERERDGDRSRREVLRASIPGDRNALPQAEVNAIKAKLGVGGTVQENSGRSLETRTVHETGGGAGEQEFNAAVDREVNALLDSILSMKTVTTPGHETPDDFTSAQKTPTGGVTPGRETPDDFKSVKTYDDFLMAVVDAFRDVGASVKQSYRETPPEEHTPEELRRVLDMLRKTGEVCMEQLKKARRQDANFSVLMMEMIGMITSVAAGAAILSAVSTLLKLAQAFLEAKWTAETSETKLMTRKAKERLEEMLEKIKQIVEDLKMKLKLLMVRAEDRRTLHEGVRVGGFRAPAAVAGLQLSSAMLVQRRLEDVEKLVAGYERRMKERFVAGDSVKVM